jgi:hypothetical protein
MTFALPTTTKYGFRIRTRTGMMVENLAIHGRDEADAERKLRQMYAHCQVLECRVLDATSDADCYSLEEVLTLVSK